MNDFLVQVGFFSICVFVFSLLWGLVVWLKYQFEEWVCFLIDERLARKIFSSKTGKFYRVINK